MGKSTITYQNRDVSESVYQILFQRLRATTELPVIDLLREAGRLLLIDIVGAAQSTILKAGRNLSATLS